MAALKVCAQCKYKNRYALNPGDKICAKCKDKQKPKDKNKSEEEDTQ